MGFQNQFGSGEVIHQQSQAQSQAQTQAQLAQAQLAQLREQNSILNQQLASQAQSHIQHLQQLLPIHQSASTLPPSQSANQAPEPSIPVPQTSNQPAPSALFSPEEMLEQVKDTVVSTMKDVVEKNQDRPLGQASALNPDHPSLPIHPPIQSQSSSLIDFPPAVPPPTPQRRSRSHHHQPHSERVDKRPISFRRSLPRKRSRRRPHRSCKPRPPSRRRRSTSRRRSRATSVTLRSASPRHREHPDRRQDDQAAYHSTYPMTNLQPAKWDSYDPQSTSTPTTYPQQSYYNTHYATKWKFWGKWKDYTKARDTSNPPGQWIDYTQQSQQDTSHNNDDSTRPLTAYSSDQYTSHYHTRRQPHRSGSIQSRQSTAVPPGHVPIDLHSGSTQNWARAVKFALEHPDRMRAANEIPASERPQPSTSTEEEQYNKACEELQQVDVRIPKAIVERAVQLFFSTHLLPDYDLSTCYTIDLHSANMIALIMPLPRPASSRCHLLLARIRTTLGHWSTAQTSQVPNRSSLKARSDRPIGPIIKIRNAAISHRLVHSSSEDKWQTVTAPFHRGLRKNSSAPLTRRAKANRTSSSGRCTMVQRLAHFIPSWRQWESSASCSWPRSGHHFGEVHHCKQPPRGVEVCRYEMAKFDHASGFGWIQIWWLHLSWKRREALPTSTSMTKPGPEVLMYF